MKGRGAFHCQDHLLLDLLANMANSLSCLPAACTPVMPPPPVYLSYNVACGYRDARARYGEVDSEREGEEEKRREGGQNDRAQVASLNSCASAFHFSFA